MEELFVCAGLGVVVMHQSGDPSGMRQCEWLRSEYKTSNLSTTVPEGSVTIIDSPECFSLKFV